MSWNTSKPAAASICGHQRPGTSESRGTQAPRSSTSSNHPTSLAATTTTSAITACGRSLAAMRRARRADADTATTADSSVANPPSRCVVTTCGHSFSVTVHMPNARLHDHEQQQRKRQRKRHVLGARPRIASDRHEQNQQSQRAGEVPMHHLRPRLVGLERRVRESRLRRLDVGGRARNGQIAVASGPIGTSEPRILQSRVCAEHDDCERKHHADRGTPRRTSRTTHRAPCRSANVRDLQQLLQILQNRFARIAIVVAQHEFPNGSTM